MFKLYAEKNQLTVRRRETVTTGSVNVYDVEFTFSRDWEDLTATAVFRVGKETPFAIILGEDGRCVIPWELLDRDSARKDLYAGVCGVKDGNTVLPTVWAKLVTIEEGVSTCCAATPRPPTPNAYEQVLAQLKNKADGLEYQDGHLHLKAGEAVLSDVPIPSGGGGGGSFYEIGHGLKVEGNTLSVNSVSDFEGDNSLPITASAVQSTVGNIEILLQTI